MVIDVLVHQFAPLFSGQLSEERNAFLARRCLRHARRSDLISPTSRDLSVSKSRSLLESSDIASGMHPSFPIVFGFQREAHRCAREVPHGLKVRTMFFIVPPVGACCYLKSLSSLRGHHATQFATVGTSRQQRTDKQIYANRRICSLHLRHA